MLWASCGEPVKVHHARAPGEYVWGIRKVKWENFLDVLFCYSVRVFLRLEQLGEHVWHGSTFLKFRTENRHFCLNNMRMFDCSCLAKVWTKRARSSRFKKHLLTYTSFTYCWYVSCSRTSCSFCQTRWKTRTSSSRCSNRNFSPIFLTNFENVLPRHIRSPNCPTSEKHE